MAWLLFGAARLATLTGLVRLTLLTLALLTGLLTGLTLSLSTAVTALAHSLAGLTLTALALLTLLALLALIDIISHWRFLSCRGPRQTETAPVRFRSKKRRTEKQNPGVQREGCTPG